MLTRNDEISPQTAAPIAAGGMPMPASMPARAATGVFGDSALPTPGLPHGQATPRLSEGAPAPVPS